MKQYINKDTINKIKYQISTQSKATLQLIKIHYLKLNKHQRTCLLTGVGVIALVVIAMSISDHSHTATPTKPYPIHFENKTQNHKVVPVVNTQTLQLQSQLRQVKHDAQQQYASMRSQLQAIQSNMTSLASQQAIKHLQQTVGRPNKTLLGKVNKLQDSLQTIVKQTAEKTWVDPKSVTSYFQLTAVQGFSDGMRAIIDINGNQTALSINEICPACHGWSLTSMDFSNQSAVFVKHDDDQHTLYVKLNTH